jgi:hypothetical protein
VTVVEALAASVTWVADWRERIVVSRLPAATPAPGTRIGLPTSWAVNVPDAEVRIAAPLVIDPSDVPCADAPV